LAKSAGVPRRRIIREQLELARRRHEQPFLHLAGSVKGARLVRAQGIRREVTGIADSGFLVAFANRNDRNHAWALEIASRIDRPLFTCDAVLAEAAFHLQDTSVIPAMTRYGLVEPRFVVSDHLARLAEMAKRYSDGKPDLADICLIRLSELNPSLNLVTPREGAEAGSRHVVLGGKRGSRPDPW
jgi:predicted nucleic acid-binding protein